MALAQGFALMAAVAAGIGLTASIAGLLISYYINVPSGLAIILSAGLMYLLSLLSLLSLLFCQFGRVLARYFPYKHLIQCIMEPFMKKTLNALLLCA